MYGRGCNRVVSTNVVAIRDAGQQLETFHLTGCTLYASCDEVDAVFQEWITLDLRTPY